MKAIEFTEGLASVKMYQVVNRGQWTAYLVAWFEEGKRKRKQITDKNEAEKFAKDTTKRLADGSGNMVTIPRRILNRYQKLENNLHGATLEAVVDEYIARHKLTRLKRDSTPEVLSKFLGYLASTLDFKPSYKQTLQACAKTFEKAFQMPIDEIMPTDIETYLDLSGQDRKSKANTLAGFRTIMQWAKDNGYLSQDHPTSADQASNKGQIDFLEPKQLKALIQETPPHILPFIVISAFTALPQQEVKRLRWEDINWSRQTLSTRGLSSTYQTGNLELNESILELLNPHKKSHGPILESPIESLGLKRLAAKIGLKWKTSILTRSARLYKGIQRNPETASSIGVSLDVAKAWFQALAP